MDFCRLCQENRASIPIKSDLNFIEAISKLTDLNVICLHLALFGPILKAFLILGRRRICTAPPTEYMLNL